MVDGGVIAGPDGNGVVGIGPKTVKQLHTYAYRTYVVGQNGQFEFRLNGRDVFEQMSELVYRYP